MKRIRIVGAYDGTNYCGWQIQPNGITIEEILNKSVEDLPGRNPDHRCKPDRFRSTRTGKCSRIRYRIPDSA